MVCYKVNITDMYRNIAVRLKAPRRTDKTDVVCVWGLLCVFWVGEKKIIF